MLYAPPPLTHSGPVQDDADCPRPCKVQKLTEATKQTHTTAVHDMPNEFIAQSLRIQQALHEIPCPTEARQNSGISVSSAKEEVWFN